MVESVKSVEVDDKNFCFVLLLKLKAAGGSRTFEYGTEGKEDWSVEKDIGVSQEVLFFIFKNFIPKTLLNHYSYFLFSPSCKMGLNSQI